MLWEPRALNLRKTNIRCVAACVVGLTVLVLALHSYSVLAAERYTRKSISRVNDVLLIGHAKQISQARLSFLIEQVRQRVEMARFDFNELPGRWHIGFWEQLQNSPDLRQLDSIAANSAEFRRLEQRVTDLTNQIIATSRGGGDASGLQRERDAVQGRRRALDTRIGRLKKQAEQLKQSVFQEAARSLTEAIGPILKDTLSDPELQRIRAQALVSETERQRFIIAKARTLGISSDDLEKVMDSAYVYMVFLTYAPPSPKIDAPVSGGIAWFKVDISRPEPEIRLIEIIEVDLVAPQTFAQNMRQETRRMDDFRLSEVIIARSGAQVSFPLGTRDGVQLDQRFVAYESYMVGNQIKERKKGFLYVSKVGDNATDQGALSRGVVIGGRLDSGMQVREYPMTGWDVQLRIKAGRITLGPGLLQSGPQKRTFVLNQVDTPIYALSLSIRRNLASMLNVSQLFLTLGAEIAGVDLPAGDVVVEALRAIVPTSGHVGAEFGVLKRHYVGRAALLIQPLVRFDVFTLSAGFTHSAFALAPNVGIEYALRENVSMGATVGFRLINLTGGWSSTVGATDPILEYPKVSFSYYLSYSLPKLYSIGGLLKKIPGA